MQLISAKLAYSSVTNLVFLSGFFLDPCAHHIRDITDPEHPYSLEQLNVVSEEAIVVDDKGSKVG